MGWFSSSSSSEPATNSGSAPDRSQRSQCWESRDAYFACLDKNGVQVPGQEGEACKQENNEYKGKCAGSWVSRQISHRFEECGDGGTWHRRCCRVSQRHEQRYRTVFSLSESEHAQEVRPSFFSLTTSVASLFFLLSCH